MYLTACYTRKFFAHSYTSFLQKMMCLENRYECNCCQWEVARQYGYPKLNTGVEYSLKTRFLVGGM